MKSRFLIFSLILSVLLLGMVIGSWAQGKSEDVRSSPKDTTPYVRETVPEDYAPEGFLGAFPPAIFIVDAVVNNTDPNLTNTDTANDGETSIAVNPLDPNEIVISTFSGSWGANAPIYHTTDGGITWTKRFTIPNPPGIPLGCPCDQAFDYGRNDELSATFLVVSPTVGGGVDVVSGTTTDPATAASWDWLTPGGVTQLTNGIAVGSIGNADQPWLLVNRDPTTAGQDNVYVAYDDFNNSDGVDGQDMRVAVSYGANPPNFTVDSQTGNAIGGVNPGHRMAKDPRTGYMYSLFQRNTAGGANPKNINYMLNRSTDGGATWTLNASATGIVVANADSTQPQPKFGTVNALLGGVLHAAVDPNTGDIYYVYGNRDAGTGNNRLAIRRIVSDGAGGVTVGAENFVTGQVQAAIPSVAVTSDGTVGIFYYTFDGFSSDGFPIFTAWLALSTDKGVTFATQRLLTFLSSAKDSGDPRQRVLGDYMQMKAVENCFYGAFTGNGVPFGRPVANHDPIFFSTCVGPTINVPSSVTLGDVCVGSTGSTTLDVCNTGNSDLIVQAITSSDPQFTVADPGYPLTVSPDFCFPFEVLFTPTTTGLKSANLTIPSNDPANPSIVVQATGNGVQQKIATAIANSGSFGNVCVGSFKDLDLTISNSGGCDLVVSGISSSSPEFKTAQVLNFPLVIRAGDSIHVPIRFEPTSPGSGKLASITIISNDPPNKVVSVSGDAPSGDIRVTGSTDFANVCAGTQPEKSVPICNVGACNLNITSVAFDPACSDFTLVNNPFPAPVSKDFCLDVVIRFTPTSAGPKSCTLVINSDDLDTPIKTLTVTANTPAASIDVPPDQGFPPTVIQSVGACQSLEPFPISNTGTCNLNITSITIGGDNGSEFSLSGKPSYPIILQPGHIAGEGNLNLVFKPTELDRDRIGSISVTYESDPITGATTTETRALCGEGVRTGARVLVRAGGAPVAMVERIHLQRINANRNKKILDTTDNARDLPLQTVTPDAPCASFQYHREYGTVSNPIQLLPGSYQVTATAIVDGKRKSKTVGFDVTTCGFNPNIEVNF